MLRIISNPSQTTTQAPASRRPDAIYLDTLMPANVQVGYGSLGTSGELGYDGNRAVVCGRDVLRGLSAHASSRLVFELNGRFAEFNTSVGVADTAIRFQTKCKFTVRVDGRDVWEVTTTAGAAPQKVSLEVHGTQWMELITTSDRFEHAHSVWIDPQLVPNTDADPDSIPGNVRIGAVSAQLDQSHTLVLHGNLGDQAAYTGLPYAYWKATRRRLHINSDRPEFRCLWDRNPYCDLVDTPVDITYRVRFEDFGELEDWKLYRPQRIFMEMTGQEIAPAEVCPALYYHRSPREKRVVVCDQASWRNRRGYPHLNSLCERLRDVGWEVVYIRNTNVSERQIFCEHTMLKLNLAQTIEFMGTASLFIGYDSGLAHIAAGLHVPSIQFAGATPPHVFKHPNCIYCLEACHHCCTDPCAHNCLETAPNRTDEILSAIDQHFG